MKHTSAALAFVALLLLGGCTGEAAHDAADQTSQSASLDAATIRALTEQYPRLGPEPLPEPQPQANAAPASRSLETSTGEATFYAQKFDGNRTASGIPFRQNQLVAAHRAYPFGTILRVTNTENDRAVTVRVVDRGPHGASARARRTIIDLSRRAASQLGFIRSGRAPVRVEVLEWGPGVNG